MYTIKKISALLILAQMKECSKSAKINCALNILVLQYAISVQSTKIGTHKNKAIHSI